ncbi:hypothetical protein [Pseudomonas sp. B16120]|uniref:hypothetical protein n=1 Tax=Pseudomonas sp. B16120 TaxID=3235108 RepID=UPI003782DF7B
MWNVISNYPHHRSPYFSALDRAFAVENIESRHFPELKSALNSNGVISLHRLQRLYRDENGPNPALLNNSLQLLSLARQRGLKLAWTVHNLLPIYGEEPTSLDRQCMQHVLDLSDMVICHTHADAGSIRQLAPRANVSVSGSAGLWMEETEHDTSLEPLLCAMDDCEQAFLAFGHITAYKDLLRVGRTFLQCTNNATLFIVGEARDSSLLGSLRDLQAASGGRLMLWPLRVDPSEAHRLYRRAAVAVCSYLTTGRYAYFRDVLHPSSISTARGFNVPVITPDLPATRELAVGVAAVFYASDVESSADLGAALRLAETRFREPSYSSGTARDEWIQIARFYKEIEPLL